MSRTGAWRTSCAAPKPGLGEYRLTPRALADLDAIAEYTLDRWGRAQAETYLTALTARMAWLAESPGRGQRRDDIAPGYRCFREGRHLVFYVVTGAEVSIIGVPHTAMDPVTHLV